MREKIKRFTEKISSSPTYAKFLRKRDKLAERIKNALLACLSTIAPLWNFLFLRKSQDAFSGEPASSNTDTKSPGYKLNYIAVLSSVPLS